MDINSKDVKHKNILTPQQIKRASWELGEEEEHPIFTESQIKLFNHVDNYEDALAVLDEKNEVKNKLRRK